MKRVICLLLLFTVLSTLSACDNNSVKGSVVKESTYGNAELDIMPQKLLEQVDIGDMVIVSIGDLKKEMPFVDELVIEDKKLQLFFDKANWSISVCMYNDNFCDKYDINIGSKVIISKNNNLQ